MRRLTGYRGEPKRNELANPTIAIRSSVCRQTNISCPICPTTGSPKAPWNPPQKLHFILPVSLDIVSHRLNRTAPQLSPFGISIFTFCLTIPKTNNLWYSGAHQAEGNKYQCLPLPFSFLQWSDFISISFPLQGGLSVPSG